MARVDLKVTRQVFLPSAFLDRGVNLFPNFRKQLILHRRHQKQPLGITVEGSYNTFPLFNRSQCLVMA